MRVLKKKPIQVYIEPGQNNILEALSKKKGVSKAEIIRESLEHYFQKLPVEEDPALDIIGLGNSGKRDLSKKHDKYVIQHSFSKKMK